MPMTLTLVGETLADIYRQLNLDKTATNASTEELIEELRRRLRPQGLVVNIDPVEEPPDVEAETEAVAEAVAEAIPTTAPTPDKPKRGRPPKPDNGKAAARAAEPATDGPTRDEVIAALNSYSAARGGQVAARQVMQETCGVARLVDIKPEDYPKLLARLTA